MTRTLLQLKSDPELRASVVRSGLETILSRHTCAHRVEELLNIVEQLRAPSLQSVA
jgi:spore maturation protein CgeB